jgi:hypothetical protein
LKSHRDVIAFGCYRTRWDSHINLRLKDITFFRWKLSQKTRLTRLKRGRLSQRGAWPGRRLGLHCRLLNVRWWTLAFAGVTALDLGAVFPPVIPAKAGIHEFSHRLFAPPFQTRGEKCELRFHDFPPSRAVRSLDLLISIHQFWQPKNPWQQLSKQKVVGNQIVNSEPVAPIYCKSLKNSKK